jgi:hypothetical protein
MTHQAHEADFMNEHPTSAGVIEAGWRQFQLTMPELSASTTSMLRFVFFSGAHHYRTTIKKMFNLEDGDARYQLLLDLATELHAWERREQTAHILLRRESDGQ